MDLRLVLLAFLVIILCAILLGGDETPPKSAAGAASPRAPPPSGAQGRALSGVSQRPRSKRFTTFMNERFALTDDLLKCPGIGDEGARLLKRNKVSNLGNLIGLGLSFNGDTARLKKALEKDYGIKDQCVSPLTPGVEQPPLALLQGAG